MLRLVLSSLRANSRRLISTSIAVCLGVALLAGTMVLGDTLKANFDDLFQSSLGNADAVVRSANTLDTDGEFAQDLIDGSLADELATMDGVAAVVPQIEGFGQLTGADGEKLGGNGPPTVRATGSRTRSSTRSSWSRAAPGDAHTRSSSTAARPRTAT